MTKKPYPSDKLDQYIVRFPDGMRDQIREAADVNRRSMNAEIIARLEASFTPFADPEAVAKAYEQGRRDAGAPDHDVRIPLTDQRFDEWLQQKVEAAMRRTAWWTRDEKPKDEE